MAELSLNCRDVAGLLYEVPAHGVAGVMGGVTPYPGQIACLIPNRIDHPGVKSAVAGGECNSHKFIKKRQKPI